MTVLSVSGECWIFADALFEFDFLGVLAAAALIWLFARPNTPAVEPGTLLVLDLDGTVVESDPLRSISADLKSLMKSRGASTRLIDVTEALRFAGSDERIAGVIMAMLPNSVTDEYIAYIEKAMGEGSAYRMSIRPYGAVCVDGYIA